MSAETWTPPEPVIIVGEPGAVNRWRSVEARCPLCGFVSFSAVPEGVGTGFIRSHLVQHIAQHAPGRAVDIAVDWEPSASCSVCEDGIGRIVQDSTEVLRCAECGTTWDIDGTGGEREEEDGRG